jgi:hypothetical protein
MFPNRCRMWKAKTKYFFLFLIESQLNLKKKMQEIAIKYCKKLILTSISGVNNYKCKHKYVGASEILFNVIVLLLVTIKQIN